MKITVDQARPYFSDPSQHVQGVTDRNIPEQGCEYWAEGPVCMVFHSTAAQNVWMVHIAVKPEGRGSATEPTLRLLCEFWKNKRPQRIVAWIESHRRAAVALAKRVGGVVDGTFPGTVMLGWSL